MKTNKLSATIILTMLIIFSPQNSNSEVENGERQIFPIFEKLFEVQTKQGTLLKQAITQNTHYYPKDLQVFDFTHETPTLDKKFVLLKVQVFWEISELEKYQKNIKSYNGAKNLVWDFAEEAIRRVIIAHDLKDIVKRSEIYTLDNIRCSRDIELEAIKLSNNNLLKVGIKIVNVEAKISYPI